MKGQTRTFEYSTTGWLLSAANPESGTTTYDYTASGQLLKKIDAEGRRVCMGTLSGTSCTASYDGAGRPLRKSYSDGTAVTYEYDRGWLWKVNNSVAAVTYGYDLLDRVTSRTQTVSSVNYQHTATYKPAGLWTETYHSGRVITYGRDAVGRVTGVSGVKSGQARTYLSSASYAPHGAPSSLSFGNSQTETWTWNYRLQPASVARGSALSLTYYYCPSQGTVCATNNGSMVSQTIGHVGVAQTYGYDAFGRLTSVSKGAGWSRSYGYDRYGNQWVSSSPGLTPSSFTPQSQSWINAANNRLTNASLPIQHDNAGQMTKIGGLDWEYDGEGKIKKSTLNSIVTTMSYDGEGNRVKKQTGTRTTTMVYGVSGQLVEEYDTAPATETDVRYLAADHLGSTRMVFNQSGTATACLDYVPFGEQIPQGMNGRSGACWTTANEPRQKFTGKERDSETNLDYFGARYLSGAMGRFTTPDSAPPNLGNPQSWNRYTYALNNPLRFVDPDGDLSLSLYRYDYTITFADKDKKGNTVTYSVNVTVYITVVTHDDGSISSLNASGRAANLKGDSLDLTKKQLAAIADTAATLVRHALATDLGEKLKQTRAEIVNAIGAQETRLGILAPENPLQLAGSSGIKPSKSDRDYNIQQALSILRGFVERYDLFKGLARYNGAADPEGYARKVIQYYDQIRGTLDKREAVYTDTLPKPRVIQ